MELQTMSLERNQISNDDPAALRRARRWGVFSGIVLGIPLAPLAMWGFATFALPAAAHRVFVVIDPDSPGRIVRAEIDGWPLTPRLAGEAGIEFALERTNRNRSHLTIEFRPDDGTPPLRAIATIERRRCDIVVVFDAAGGAVSECAHPVSN
jgi:hypothetical protein